jgi:hypothetical protein
VPGVHCHLAPAPAPAPPPPRPDPPLQVLVVGSQNPTYETMALAYGAAEVVVGEYQLPAVGVPSVRYVHAQDLATSGERFDAVLSVSSVEHDGLGRCAALCVAATGI